jgi:hypothetical protein
MHDQILPDVFTRSRYCGPARTQSPQITRAATVALLLLQHDVRSTPCRVKSDLPRRNPRPAIPLYKTNTSDGSSGTNTPVAGTETPPSSIDTRRTSLMLDPIAAMKSITPSLSFLTGDKNSKKLKKFQTAPS